jgi:hypothetical protein
VVCTQMRDKTEKRHGSTFVIKSTTDGEVLSACTMYIQYVRGALVIKIGAFFSSYTRVWIWMDRVHHKRHCTQSLLNFSFFINSGTHHESSVVQYSTLQLPS